MLTNDPRYSSSNSQSSEPNSGRKDNRELSSDFFEIPTVAEIQVPEQKENLQAEKNALVEELSRKEEIRALTRMEFEAKEQHRQVQSYRSEDNPVSPAPQPIQRVNIPVPPTSTPNTLPTISIGEFRLLQDQIKALSSQLIEAQKTNEVKNDRLVKAVRRLDEIQNHHRQELARQYAQICGKMTERRLSSAKIEELIDRHNSVIVNFESRMSQMKKLLQEKEMQFLKAKTALEEAQMEINRLRIRK